MRVKNNIIICLIFIIFLSLQAFALDQWSSDAENLNINIQIVGEIETSEPANTKYIQILLDYNPVSDYRQQVIDQMHFPEEAYKGMNAEKLSYQFTKISSSKIEYGVSSNLKVKNYLVPVSNADKFPLENVPKDAIQYVMPSPTIDSDNSDVLEMSHKLAQGEDDLYILVSKMAAWVSENVVYDVTVKRFGDSLDASWVLSHKIGVCKEKTDLLIALLRAQGIPARFVSGVAYSNLNLTGSPWSPHAWAEVYFPSTGWVPFDPTYQQYGFLDPTHISLKKGMDGSGETISFKWNENGSKVHITPVFISTKVEAEQGKIQKRATITPHVKYPSVNIGSYNLIETEIENNLDSYISPIVMLGNVNGVTVMSPNPVLVILKPREKKKIDFIIKTASTLQKEFSYEIPVVVSTTMSDESRTSFEVYDGAENINYDYLSNLTTEYESETKIHENMSDYFEAICKPRVSDYVYENSTFLLVCRILNKGGKTQEVSVCTEDLCQKTKVWANSFREIGFNATIQAEPKIIKVFVTTSKRTYNFRFGITPVDRPTVTISNLVYPESVKYSDKFSLSFSLNKGGKTNPIDATTTIQSPYDAQQIKIDSLDQQRDISLKISAANLNEGNNTIFIKTKYFDKYNTSFESEKNISIVLKDLTAMQKAESFLRHLLLRIFGFLR